MQTKLVVRRAVFCLMSAFAALPAAAQILGTTARQSPSGSLKFLAYYQGVSDQNLNFSVDSSARCNAAPPSAASFPCASSTDVETKGSGGAGLVKIVWQAAERFALYATVGTGDYSIKVPSTTASNVISGDKNGIIYGAGLKASIVPDTIVNPAIALDLGITRSHYNFNRINPGGTPGIGNGFSQSLDLTTYQVAVETSHLFEIDSNWKLEPYGGVLWRRVQADLKDLAGGGHAGGHKDTGTPFLGLRIPAEDRIAFFAEASFVDGTQYGGGLELRFK
ncbi:MAG: autotransporter outer membrane beta-barrel domain-containing protein [Elusimicrobiota bacterium]|nr:MAG: autotransporter outer membrane beta-barrel domain-containing protein [Elusimicrobiota bacterium]